MPGLSPLDRGNLVHDVLAGVWKELGTQETLVTENSSYLKAVVHDEVESCIRKLAMTKRALREPRFAALEQMRLEQLVTDWLELEKERKPFIVLPPEEQRQVNIGGIDLTIVRIVSIGWMTARTWLSTIKPAGTVPRNGTDLVPMNPSFRFTP